MFGVEISNEQLSCATQKPFDSNSSAALSIYWEKDWHTGNDYKCMLVNYQTAYSALLPGDYEKCVEKNWNVVLK